MISNDESKVKVLLNKIEGMEELPPEACLPDCLSLVEVIRAEGASFLIKFDGERTASTITIMATGGPLRGDFVRRETDDLLGGLIAVIKEYFVSTRDQAF